MKQQAPVKNEAIYYLSYMDILSLYSPFSKLQLGSEINVSNRIFCEGKNQNTKNLTESKVAGCGHEFAALLKSNFPDAQFCRIF